MYPPRNPAAPVTSTRSTIASPRDPPQHGPRWIIRATQVGCHARTVIAERFTGGQRSGYAAEAPAACQALHRDYLSHARNLPFAAWIAARNSGLYPAADAAAMSAIRSLGQHRPPNPGG